MSTREEQVEECMMRQIAFFDSAWKIYTLFKHFFGSRSFIFAGGRRIEFISHNQTSHFIQWLNAQCVWMCRVWTLQFLLTLVHILIYFISFVRDRVVEERGRAAEEKVATGFISKVESERKRRMLTPAASASAAHNQIFVFPVEWKTIIYHIKRFIFYGKQPAVEFSIHVRRDRPCWHCWSSIIPSI